MITGIAGLLLYLWVGIGLSATVTALLIGFLQIQWLPLLAGFNLGARQAWLWTIALLPVFAGIYVAGVTLIPSMSHELGFSLDHCHRHGDTHGHLCWYHPPVFVWMSWQGFCATGFAAFTLWKLLFALYRGCQQHQYSRTLLSFADTHPSFADAWDQSTYPIESDMPSAFTLGLLRPKIFMSSALIDALTPEELSVVQRHEQAHQQHRDPLRLWLFNLVLSVFTPMVRRHLYKTMELTLEQLADARVAQTSTTPVLIAQTLVKVHRLTARFLAQRPRLSICHFGGSVIEQRIEQLMSANPGRAFPLLASLACIGLLLTLTLSCADALHHTIEKLLHHSH